MSKKLDHKSRIYRELLDRYGEFDADVQKMRSELDLLESLEFRYPNRRPSTAAQSRSTGAYRRHLSTQGAA
ncbi:hypothetical protein MCEMIEM13_00721 [Comamonadaceae bacterium]